MRRIEEFAVGGRVELEVAIPAGKIQLRAGPEGTVRVSIDAKDVERFEVFQVGDTVTVREESSWRTRNRNVRVIVEAPPGFDLVADTGSANVETRGRVGGIDARTGSGDIDIDQAERLSASSASGKIRIGLVSGDVRCNTASGDVEIQSSEGQLDASTASGDVDASFAGDEVQIGTASGNVVVRNCAGDAISIKTLSGNIRLGLPNGIRVEPDITTMSGRVVLPDPSAPSESQDRRIVRIRLNSMSGNIRIERAGSSG